MNQPTVTSGFLGGLARRLVADGLLADTQARELQGKALKEQRPFVAVVVESTPLSARDVAHVASQEFGMPLLDLSVIDIDLALIHGLSEKVLKKAHAVPIYARGKKIFVAVSDPLNLQALEEIKFASGSQAEPVLVEEDKLTKALESALRVLAQADMSGGDTDLENLELGDTDPEGSGNDVGKDGADDAPIVRYINKVLVDAINQGASDVHFEPYEKTYRIRYRRDGELKTIAQPPVGQGIRLAARLKVMSRMDLAEKRVPQDGRIKLNLSRTKAIDFRVSTCPTLFGEKSAPVFSTPPRRNWASTHWATSPSRKRPT